MRHLRVMLFTLALFVAQANATPASSKATVAAPTTAPDTVLILGDSLSSAHQMPDEAGWVALLQQRLATQTPAPPTIVNISRGGKTLIDGIAELPALLEQHRPDLVVIELGGNDAIMGMGASDLQRHFSVLIGLAQAAGSKVVVLGFAIPPAFDKDGSAENLRGVYVDTARDKDVTLLPSLLAGISDDPALLQDDGIHPNAAAQPRVLDNAWATLRPLLLD